MLEHRGRSLGAHWHLEWATVEINVPLLIRQPERDLERRVSERLGDRATNGGRRGRVAKVDQEPAQSTAVESRPQQTRQEGQRDGGVGEGAPLQGAIERRRYLAGVQADRHEDDKQRCPAGPYNRAEDSSRRRRRHPPSPRQPSEDDEDEQDRERTWDDGRGRIELAIR